MFVKDTTWVPARPIFRVQNTAWINDWSSLGLYTFFIAVTTAVIYRATIYHSNSEISYLKVWWQWELKTDNSFASAEPRLFVYKELINGKGKYIHETKRSRLLYTKTQKDTGRVLGILRLSLKMTTSSIGWRSHGIDLNENDSKAPNTSEEQPSIKSTVDCSDEKDKGTVTRPCENYRLNVRNGNYYDAEHEPSGAFSTLKNNEMITKSDNDSIDLTRSTDIIDA